MFVRVSRFIHEASITSSRGRRIGVILDHGATFRTPPFFEIVEIRATGRGEISVLFYLALISFSHLTNLINSYKLSYI